MASQGPNYPGGAVDFAGGGVEPWVNVTNVGADDGSTASITAATFDNNDVSDRIDAFDFGFSIPTDATIDGIVVEIERHKSAGNAVDAVVQLRNELGNLAGISLADITTAWPTTPTIATYGGPTNLWFGTWTPAILNDPDFGVTLSVKATGNNTDVHVDFIRVTVHYTEAGGGGSHTASGSPVATLSETASGTASLKYNASGSPVATLSAFADGTATVKYNASGSPVATLSPTADGTATLTPDPVSGSGRPVATLQPTADGDATLRFNASGSPVATLSAFASGTATMTPGGGGEPDPITGSGSPVATLQPTADGDAVLTFTASGSPVATLSAFASGTATQTFVGSGSPSSSLDATADGTATMTPDAPPTSITASGSPVATLSAFASGTALNGAPKRRALGYFFVDDEEEERKEKENEKENEELVVEAAPLPEVPEIPVVEHEVDPVRWNQALRTTPRAPRSRPRSEPEQYDDDDAEILLELLLII